MDSYIDNLKLKFVVINIIFPILLGGIIYVFFRSSNLLMFSWFKFLKLDGFIYFIRKYTVLYQKNIPYYALYSLPDGLWAYSFIAFLSLYFKNKFIYTLPGTIGAAVEILQLWFVPGTFDILDLIIIILCTLTIMFVIKLNIKENER
ncbi:MAG: hypothetical protein LBV03_03475 [Fusobacteriales bacterium]|jgi:hypothetical protein|nr:hypothetical protein [Fusobacteriales bacterium]